MKFEDLWQRVETGDPDKMEFCRGEWKPLVWMGYICTVMGVLYPLSVAGILFSFRDGLLYAFQSKKYEDLIQLYGLGGLLFLAMFEIFFVGIWFAFGKTDVVLDRRSSSIIKTYRLRSFRLFRQDYAVGPPSALLLRQETRSFAPIHYLRLNDSAEKQRRVLIIPRKFVKDGWKMAERMAEFFKIPLLAPDAA